MPERTAEPTNFPAGPGDLSFQEIHDTFRHRILRYLTRLVGEQDAEDLTQDVFVKVSKALGTFRGEAMVSTWIYRIATNAAMDHLRKSPSGQTELIASGLADDDLLPENEGGARQESAPSIDTQLIRKEMNDCIRGIVEGLPENYRTVLILSDLKGLTNSEIAGVLGISLETVKIRLHRARVRLKKELEHHCSFYKDDQNEFACDRKVSPVKFLKK